MRQQEGGEAEQDLSKPPQTCGYKIKPTARGSFFSRDRAGRGEQGEEHSRRERRGGGSEGIASPARRHEWAGTAGECRRALGSKPGTSRNLPQNWMGSSKEHENRELTQKLTQF